MNFTIKKSAIPNEVLDTKYNIMQISQNLEGISQESRRAGQIELSENGKINIMAYENEHDLFYPCYMNNDVNIIKVGEHTESGVHICGGLYWSDGTPFIGRIEAAERNIVITTTRWPDDEHDYHDERNYVDVWLSVEEYDMMIEYEWWEFRTEYLYADSIFNDYAGQRPLTTYVYGCQIGLPNAGYDGLNINIDGLIINPFIRSDMEVRCIGVDNDGNESPLSWCYLKEPTIFADRAWQEGEDLTLNYENYVSRFESVGINVQGDTRFVRFSQSWAPTIYLKQFVNGSVMFDSFIHLPVGYASRLTIYAYEGGNYEFLWE